MSTQVFNKVSTSFTAYINSLIAKNSQLIKKYENPYGNIENQKKLEIISIKLISNNEAKRIKSLSPEKLNKLKMPKFLEDSFLIQQKAPPSVAGCSLTFCNKYSKNRPRNLTYMPQLDY